jgi:hypothetical protein
MRGYKTLIQEAELMAMPPEAVAEFLKVRAGQSEGETRADPVDKDAEKALLGRDAPADRLTVSRARQTTIEGWKRPARNKG